MCRPLCTSQPSLWLRTCFTSQLECGRDTKRHSDSCYDNRFWLRAFSVGFSSSSSWTSLQPFSFTARCEAWLCSRSFAQVLSVVLLCEVAEEVEGFETILVGPLMCSQTHSVPRCVLLVVTSVNLLIVDSQMHNLLWGALRVNCYHGSSTRYCLHIYC